MAIRRDSRGRFAGSGASRGSRIGRTGTSNPAGTIAKGGNPANPHGATGAQARAAAKVLGQGKGTKVVSSDMKNQVAAGRAAKAAYQSKQASKRKAKMSRTGGSFTKTSTFMNSLKKKQTKARMAKKAA